MERKVLATLETKELNLIRGIHSEMEDSRKRYNTTLGFVAARESVQNPNTQFDLDSGEFYVEVAPDKAEVVDGDESDNG